MELWSTLPCHLSSAYVDRVRRLLADHERGPRGPYLAGLRAVERDLDRAVLESSDALEGCRDLVGRYRDLLGTLLALSVLQEQVRALRVDAEDEALKDGEPCDWSLVDRAPTTVGDGSLNASGTVVDFQVRRRRARRASA